ncbi:hypothetical protein TCDM_10438 [Trypanosoma cruzi Dm28c]|uniref:Uncharacterized protein n=1 Tax=Trypanosoma cruzi Dm28c TaxID=1416333 RepID=V5D365_TRYCR|nr:hypothetical protein TCDM_10438 [Trypanosoma cruzi Dm28c]
MRAAGEAHRAVVMSVSVGVRVEQLGGKHTAPLAGRVQQQTIKRGKSRKEKRNSILIAPKSKKEEWGTKKYINAHRGSKFKKANLKKLNLEKKPKQNSYGAPPMQPGRTAAVRVVQKRAPTGLHGCACIYTMGTLLCASWGEVRARVHARGHTHTEREKDECVCGRCTALSPSLSRGHHRSRTRSNKKRQKRGGGVGDRGAAVTVACICGGICTKGVCIFRGFFAIFRGMFMLLVLLFFFLSFRSFFFWKLLFFFRMVLD